MLFGLIQVLPEALDLIKYPPKIDDVIREQSVEERKSNSALVPEIIDEQNDELS
ncbi:hypothetical protein LC653_21175 [Nostoc sp. CHAB 5784]|uniref:hypothetical protein n=1 Tax=Nostoc mirabile TaxID=2907820 RepID=UPI001E421855|nr:hypothetical protein [Nostoc mirabile]MCC5666360.1 hypothetical protein [Nostoc mirabile CHAB5784]